MCIGIGRHIRPRLTREDTTTQPESPMDQPGEDGGIYNTAQIVRAAATLANELLAWSQRQA